ncbi:FAD-dependent oxidoreductase [Nocardia rhamnosiphila]
MVAATQSEVVAGKHETVDLAAARHGAQVLLLEPGQHVGGMVSGGLGYTDVGEDLRVIGGMAAAFAQSVADYYGVGVDRYAGPEPHVAEEIFRSWLADAGVTVEHGAALSGVETSDGRITAVVVGEQRYVAGVFIDASYEGDLLAIAGVPYAIGRESYRYYGESLAGRRELFPGRHQFPPFVSPFRRGSTELAPFIRDEQLATCGTGDAGLMAYGYRVCLTRSRDRRPFEPSARYDPAGWDLARNWFQALERNHTELHAEQVISLVQNLPADKVDGNSNGPLSLNLLDGSNWAYPEADPEHREKIRRHHFDYTRDFLYFMSSDPDVPEGVRKGLSEWGLPVDEFTDTEGLPHQLYIREARRMVGEYTLTQHDLLPRPVPQYDSIAMGSYHIDIREVQRGWLQIHEYPNPIPEVVNEGYLSVGVSPYQIPYRCLTPRYRDCTNLLVPVCLSATHVAFASVRMEPQYEMLGHAAGIAAALALNADHAVQRVAIGDLQRRLAEEGQVLAL